MDIDDIGGIIIGSFFFLFIGLMMGMIVVDSSIDVKLNQETADDICRQLINDSMAVGLDDTHTHNNVDGKLICKIPSFDATQNIIVKINNE